MLIFPLRSSRSDGEREQIRGREPVCAAGVGDRRGRVRAGGGRAPAPRRLLRECEHSLRLHPRAPCLRPFVPGLRRSPRTVPPAAALASSVSRTTTTSLHSRLTRYWRGGGESGQVVSLPDRHRCCNYSTVGQSDLPPSLPRSLSLAPSLPLLHSLPLSSSLLHSLFIPFSLPRSFTRSLTPLTQTQIPIAH